MLTDQLLLRVIFIPTFSIGDILTGIIPVVAAIGLFFTGYQFRRTYRQAQVKLAADVYNNILGLESELEDIPGPRYPNDSDYNTKILSWSSRFFDALEWLSLLINIREIENKELVGHFEPAIVRYYNTIFQKWASEKQKMDNNYYPQLKKLVNRVRAKSGSSWPV